MIYETVVHIFTSGHDAFEAGEYAGRTIDITKLQKDESVSCEPTRPIADLDTSKKSRV